jgi:hypothetical protein
MDRTTIDTDTTQIDGDAINQMRQRQGLPELSAEAAAALDERALDTDADQPGGGAP